MKAISFLSLLVLATPLAAQNDAKPAENQPNGAVAAYTPNQQAFLNLPEENRKEFIKHLGEAYRLYQQKRIFETLEELDKAEKVFADSAELYSLRGSCFVEMRAFDKALAQYEKARTFSKDNVSLDFNIAEVYFVTKEWKKSLEMLDKVLKNLPPQSLALSRVVEFKKMLCMNKLGMKDEAAILAEKYDFLDDSPFYYFAQAALAYEKKDTMAAEAWIARANRIFRDPNVLNPWQDTFVEYGYVKGSFGDDAPGE